MKTHTPAVNDLKFWDVSLCRYSAELKEYVAEFKALRAMDKVDTGRADVSVTVNLKNGKSVKFECSQERSSNEYYANGSGKYEPLEVVSFRIDATRESWLDDAEVARHDAAQEAKQAALDRELKRLDRKEREGNGQSAV